MITRTMVDCCFILGLGMSMVGICICLFIFACIDIIYWLLPHRQLYDVNHIIDLTAATP